MSFWGLDGSASLGGGGPIPPASVAAVIALLALAFMTLRVLFGRRGPDSRELPEGDPAEEPLREALPSEDLDRLERSQPLAVFFVGGEHHLERHSLQAFREKYARQYSQILFVSVGLVDYAWMDSGTRGRGNRKESEDLKRLLQTTRRSLDPCIAAAHEMGLKADCRVAVSTDEAAELERLALEVARLYSRAIFFVSKLVWEKKSWAHRILHAETADLLRGRLENRGLPVTVLPVVIPASA